MKNFIAVGIGIFVCNICIWLGVGLLAASLITSSVKIANNQCGQQYGIERSVPAIAGSLFCP